MKSFNKKDVFTLVTAEEAKAYIGKQGYFGDSFGELEEDIKKGCSGQLVGVFPDRYTSIVFKPYASDSSYGLFLPVDKLKEVKKPKKYQPFKTFEEFKACTHKDIGDVIVFKKRNTEQINITLVTGYHGSCLHKLGLGCMGYSFQELFYDYLWLDTNNNNWKTFGVLDENN